MARYTDTSLFVPFALHMNHQNNYFSPMTTTTTTATTTVTTNTSLESSGSDQCFETSDFEVSDFFSFDQWANEQESIVGLGQTVENYVGGTSHSQNDGDVIVGGNIHSRERKEKLAFRMMSEIDVVNDGFKWRKYGKKMVKNSPNPRNYYKCSVDGCAVKKRVERDRDDKRYVITTYEGNHNHPSTH